MANINELEFQIAEQKREDSLQRFIRFYEDHKKFIGKCFCNHRIAYCDIKQGCDQDLTMMKVDSIEVWFDNEKIIGDIATFYHSLKRQWYNSDTEIAGTNLFHIVIRGEQIMYRSAYSDLYGYGNGASTMFSMSEFNTKSYPYPGRYSFNYGCSYRLSKKTFESVRNMVCEYLSNISLTVPKRLPINAFQMGTMDDLQYKIRTLENNGAKFLTITDAELLHACREHPFVYGNQILVNQQSMELLSSIASNYRMHFSPSSYTKCTPIDNIFYIQSCDGKAKKLEEIELRMRQIIKNFKPQYSWR